MPAGPSSVKSWQDRSAIACESVSRSRRSSVSRPTKGARVGRAASWTAAVTSLYASVAVDRPLRPEQLDGLRLDRSANEPQGVGAEEDVAGRPRLLAVVRRG